MTIDEAIKDLEYGIEQLEMEIKSGLWIKGSEPELRCKEGIALNKQHIEWLTELKEAKRLLKVAVEGYNFIGHITKDYACPSAISCSACPMDEEKQCRIWEHADEALALIGGDDTND